MRYEKSSEGLIKPDAVIDPLKAAQNHLKIAAGRQELSTNQSTAVISKKLLLI